MLKSRSIFLWIICAWMWTTTAHAQPTQIKVWEEHFGRIAVYDTVAFPKFLKHAADSLAKMDGIILDLRELPKDKIWSMSIWTSLQREFEDYTKPFVICLGEKIREDQPLWFWMKEREWSRFEPSGSLSKAEAKVKTLHGRFMKDGTERMEWLMQQNKTK